MVVATHSSSICGYFLPNFSKKEGEQKRCESRIRKEGNWKASADAGFLRARIPAVSLGRLSSQPSMVSPHMALPAKGANIHLFPPAALSSAHRSFAFLAVRRKVSLSTGSLPADQLSNALHRPAVLFGKRSFPARPAPQPAVGSRVPGSAGPLRANSNTSTSCAQPACCPQTVCCMTEREFCFNCNPYCCTLFISFALFPSLCPFNKGLGFSKFDESCPLISKRMYYQVLSHISAGVDSQMAPFQNILHLPLLAVPHPMVSYTPFLQDSSAYLWSQGYWARE